MKFTFGWLKQHLETEASLETVIETLIRLGLEVEGAAERAKGLEDFIVAHVVKAEPHPNADKLSVCHVDTGREVVQVVCGAPNARTGMKGVFARAGLTVPGTNLLLKAAEIRGVASNGMLCSMREMGLSDEHEGIIELPEDAPVGRPFAPVLGLDDPVIEIKATPNRQDCLGVHGIARDLAAAGLGKLKPLATEPVPGRFKSPIEVKLDFTPETADACPLFVGRYIRAVRNGPSPLWLQRRLAAIGLRPISALVDVTNFLTYDLNRPLHVFDADKVKGHIRPRLARPGESLHALDGRTYELDTEMCVIADDLEPQGLGGVMGGEHSGVTEATVNIFVEAALFDPVRTAVTGRKLGIHSDARYRFERGVDPDFVPTGMEIATRLILELCGGEPSEIVIAGKAPAWRRTITFDPRMTLHLGGLDLPTEAQSEILTRLGFGVRASADRLEVTVPPWRSDIDGPADFVEEVARVHGYDAIPSTPLPRLSEVPKPALTPAQRRVRVARRTLAGRGLVECVTYSFLSAKEAELFGGGQEELKLANPIAAELDTMRPSILPNLIAAARRNMARGFANLALFEVGPQYAADTPQGQSTAASGIRTGQSGPRHWQAAPRPVDCFDAKADALALLAGQGVAVEGLQVTTDAPAWYHPGRSGTLRMGPKMALAHFGELHPRILAALDIKGPVVGFEAVLESVPQPRAKSGKARPPLVASDFQAVERDFAFLLDQATQAEQLVKAARGVDRNLITQVTVFDLYQGKGLPEGKKSLAISVRMEPRDRTMTEPEIEAVAAKIVAAVAKQTGGTLRG